MQSATTFPIDNAPATDSRTADWPRDLAPVLQQVDVLLRAGRPGQAQEVLRRSRASSPWLTNAVGVCLLRQGHAAAAVDTFRGLALSGLDMKADAPTVFKANFATALVAAGNLAGGMAALHDLGPTDHPSAARLREAIGGWKRSLSLWQRLSWFLGGEPSRLVTFTEPLGELA